MGQTGYQALILRALMLARDEVPWLRDVVIDADGDLENFAELAAKHESAEVTNGSEALLAHLIALLVAFIGEALTLQLLHDLWPDLPTDDNFTQENSNE
jgi:hypothetical protein